MICDNIINEFLYQVNPTFYCDTIQAMWKHHVEKKLYESH